jgi:CcmD family protein
MKKMLLVITFILSYITVFAQDSSSPEMANVFRTSGKIYVVVAIVVIIFVGLAIYLFSIDRRLKKIEKEK